MDAIQLKDIGISDSFWSDYQKLMKEVVIPFQHEILWDKIPGVEKSYAVNNFLIATKQKEGKFGGFVFQDSDLMKWLEAVGYSLQTTPNAQLEEMADTIIDLIIKAQQDDGYVNTYYIINGLENRFTNLLDCHELYCLGHMIEGAIAYYEGTGKKALLDAACRYADLVDSLFGPEEQKAKGYPGHQIIEMALVKLAEITGEEKYFKLASYFIDERGKKTDGKTFFDEEHERRGKTRHWGGTSDPDLLYHQAQLPVREQRHAVGHAVRAVYMYTGMTRIAQKTGDSALMQACQALWTNIAEKQLYVTGGIGQTAIGEAFTFDYDLPNDTVYSETCAAIGLIFFSHEMGILERNGKYADVMEQALYNTVLAGMAKDGRHFFYCNPLEVWPEASEKAPVRKHVVPERPNWYPCACCPPNVSRLLTSLGKYIYTADKDTIFINLFIAGKSVIHTENGDVTLTQTHAYPWDGLIRIQATSDAEQCIAIRVPGWSRKTTITLNSVPVDGNVTNGYLYLKRKWTESDVLLLQLDMSVRVLSANPLVRENNGKCAVMRGPFAYCIEEADNGACLNALSILPSEEIKAETDAQFFDKAVCLYAKGKRDNYAGNALYPDSTQITSEACTVKLIPYYLWGNRGKGEMQVWIRSGC